MTLFINWAVKPFSMAALGWLFIGYLFRPYLPADQIDCYIAGLIMLAAAPCTAMVFVWSNLTEGEPHFTLSPGGAQRHHHGVRLRADRRPAARASRRSPCRGTRCVLSVVLYIVVPVIVAQICGASSLAKGGEAALDAPADRLQPLSLVALLATLVLLFGFQGEQILRAAAGHRSARGADPHPGLFQRRPRLSAQPAGRRAALRRRTLGA